MKEISTFTFTYQVNMRWKCLQISAAHELGIVLVAHISEEIQTAYLREGRIGHFFLTYNPAQKHACYLLDIYQAGICSCSLCVLRFGKPPDHILGVAVYFTEAFHVF